MDLGVTMCPHCGIGELVLTTRGLAYVCPFCEYQELAGRECPYCAGVLMQQWATCQVCPACSFALPTAEA